MKITPELERRIERAFHPYYCEVCEGWGVYHQSPSNPEGNFCNNCSGTGFTPNGAIARDVAASIRTTINDYVVDTLGDAANLLPSKEGK